MKTLKLFTILAVFISYAAFSQKETNRTYSDDIYYSSKDAAADKAKKAAEAEKKKAEQEKSAKEADYSTTPNNGEGSDDYYQKSTKQSNKKSTTKSYEDNTPFNYDDYYDYEYATRLKRFHNNCGSYGYYDSYYTNSYWYTENPYNYGTSVYMGYNFWGPSYFSYSYYPSYMYYSNWGWGYDPWYNPYSYNPYGNYGYNPYMNGYANGYNNGYWNGYNNGNYNNNYFNSYDNNSYYYGPRKTTGGTARKTAQPTLAHRYMETVEAETQKLFEITKGRDNNPYMLNTTVNDYSSKPSTTYNAEKPTNNGNNSNGYKPTTNEPAENGRTNPANESRPNQQKPSNGNIPNVNQNNNEQPAETPSEKPRDNKPRNEPATPRYERTAPRNEPQQRNTNYQQTPPQNNGGGGRQSSPPASGGGGKRR